MDNYIPFNDGKNAYIPHEVLYHPQLSCGSKGLYCYLCSCAAQDGTCPYTLREICSNLGIVKDTFRTYVIPLIDHGYVTVNKASVDGKRPRNVYRLKRLKAV